MAGIAGSTHAWKNSRGNRHAQMANQPPPQEYLDVEPTGLSGRAVLCGIANYRDLTMVSGLFDPTIIGTGEDALSFITRLLQASTEHSIIALGPDGTILLWNEGARRLYGYEPEEVLGRADVSVLHVPEDIEAGLPRLILTAALQNTKWQGIVTRRRKNGERFVARVVITTRRDASGDANGFFMISDDISNEIRLIEELNAELEARTLAETALRESEERYRIIAETATDAIISVDQLGVIGFVNRAAERIFGHHTREMLGAELNLLMPGALRELHKATAESHSVARDQHIVWEAVEFWGTHRDGRQIPLEVSFGEYRRHGERLFTGVVRDITERKHADDKIRYLAQYDALTGLPNRVLLQDRIEHALAQARRAQERVAVLFLDLDDFKHVNDSLGHQTGDRLLQMVSDRLRFCLREGDNVGRLGGDEFVICLPLPVDERHTSLVAEKILEAMRAPLLVDDQELHVSISIGISLYPHDGEDADTLMRAADIAMYHAKENGRNNYQFFTQTLNKAARERLLITGHLHRAVKRGEFTLVYQPQMDIKSGKILAAEALIRWRHPDNGLVLPAEFIKVAEETGLIVPIGEWTLRQACQQLKRWHCAGHPALRMAVNLSPEQFRRSGFPDMVLSILRQTELPATALDLEITEGVLMRQSKENIAVLGRLAGIGIQFAVDDFGTGYSNLAYLQRFPIDTIKIDRSFVEGLGLDSSNSAIVMAVIAMSRNLNLHVVAEGVETADQVHFLRTHGCLAAQGFYYHAPLSSEAFGELLAKQASTDSFDGSIADS